MSVIFETCNRAYKILEHVDVLTSFSFATQLKRNVIIDNKKKTSNHLIIFKENLKITYNYRLLPRPSLRTKMLLMIVKDKTGN